MVDKQVAPELQPALVVAGVAEVVEGAGLWPSHILDTYFPLPGFYNKDNKPFSSPESKTTTKDKKVTILGRILIHRESNYRVMAKKFGKPKKARIYEWELKGILQGDVEILEKVTKTCSEEEKEAYFKTRDKPFLVVRSAGSLGADLVALRGNIAFPIEVKSSKYKRIRLANTPQLKEQSEKYERACEEAKLMAIYAFRLKSFRGDTWRIFTLENNNLEGIAKRINHRLTKVHKSRDGYYILRWDEGWPLNRFIDYIL